MHYFKHWSDVPAEYWRWPNFTPEELACRGTGKLGVDPVALDRLQRLRIRLGAPLILNSAFRSPEHNRAVGGAKASQHLKGRAFDVSMTNHDPEQFEAAARAVGFTGFGFYQQNDFIHVDTGPPREWGKRWTAPRFSPPPKPRPERARADRDVQGATAATGGGLAVLTGILPHIGDLSPGAQAIALVGALALAGGLGVVITRLVRRWV